MKQNMKEAIGLSLKRYNDTYMKAANDRIDNIVSQSGTDNTEIVDARIDSAGVTHTTLNNRILAETKMNDQHLVSCSGEYITAENTMGGSITNLEVLGNTIQNEEDLADIKSVGVLQEDGTYKMSISSCGKNLINPKEFGSVDSYGYCTIDIKVKSSTEYRFTHMDNSANGSILDVLQLNAKNEIISNYQGMWHGSFLTTSANTIKVRLKTHKDKVNKVKMCEGRELCYEPYQENKCDILSPCQL